LKQEVLAKVNNHKIFHLEGIFK